MNYGFYKSTFGGNLIPPELFNRFLFKAQTYLENATSNREIPEPYLSKVPYALCELAECFFRHQGSFGIKSENTDGYSISYTKDVLALELSEILNLYLGKSGVLFKGEF